MTPTRYAHAKTVVTAVDDPDREVAAVAIYAKEEMDTTGYVETAYRQVQAAKDAAKYRHKVTSDDRSPAAAAARRQRIAAMAAEGHTSRQIADTLHIHLHTVGAIVKKYGIEVIADKVVGKRHQLDSNRIVTDTVPALEGYVMGLALVEVDQLDTDQIDHWVSSLRSSVQSINRFIRELTQ